MKNSLFYRISILMLFTLLPAFVLSAAGSKEMEEGLYLDNSASIEERVNDLVNRMSIREKISQMLYKSAEIKRLGIPDHVWWNECLHGVARAGEATVFPQAIGMASSWDPELMLKVSTVISDEARAIHHEAFRNGDRGMYKGLTFWSPNINLFRDPRWGRGQETYGEDPFLASEMAIPFVKGLQGDHPEFRKVDATVKHFAVHSGPEPLRHKFDADCTDRELREYYLYSFERTIKRSEPAALMGAYNRFRGESACASPYLFNILRNEWGFKGYVVSDCGGIDDIWLNHKLEKSRVSASAIAVKAGCDLNCGAAYKRLVTAWQLGMISEAEIDVAVKRIMETRIRLGIYAKAGENPYAEIPFSKVDSRPHRELNIEMASRSMVLLKNNGILPLDQKKYKKITVIGPAAESIDVLVGNYNGTPSKPVTLAEGIRREATERGIEVETFEACDFAGRSDRLPKADSAVMRSINTSDLVIYCGGLSARLEGEEGYLKVNAEGFLGGDRTRIELPEVQEKMIKQAAATGKPVIMLMTTGSAISTAAVESDLEAILNTWYPGGEGGTAAASILFGETNPSGKLPVTFYASTDQLPHFEDYSLENRTYRHFDGKPLYPFGHGLSYTSFELSNLKQQSSNGKVTVSLSLTNSGAREGEEVVQIYASARESEIPTANQQLAGFQRVNLKAGETRTVTIELDSRAFSYWDVDAHNFLTVPGKFELRAGFSSARISERITMTP